MENIRCEVSMSHVRGVRVRATEQCYRTRVVHLNSQSEVFFCSGLDGDGDGEGGGERRQTWESWFFSM